LFKTLGLLQVCWCWQCRRQSIQSRGIKS